LKFSGEATEEETTRAEFKKIYIADHGYSIYGNMIDDETMHKIVIKAEGKDGNSYNITEIKAPSDNPEEATIALMNWGNGVKQFVDFSSMVYDPDNPTVEIVCQTRGGQPLPQFSVRFNDGEGAGRVRKFVVEPDCIPIRLTSEGLEVRRNNNYDNKAEESELVTINLADLYDTVAALSGDDGGNSAAVSVDLSAFESSGVIVESFADGSTKTSTVEFDTSGNPVKITDGDGNVTTIIW
jgi:hypothetical protein